MATVPGSSVWELVKKNNCFLIKQFGNSNAKVQFSKEPNNLYNVHSYKFSGLANSKTGCPAISGRGQVCRPVHDQDQEAEHPCQAPAQDTDAQGVPQDQPSIFDADGSASLVPTIFGHGGANDPMQSASGMSSPQDPF